MLKHSNDPKAKQDDDGKKGILLAQLVDPNANGVPVRNKKD